jgi:hypothetical protein
LHHALPELLIGEREVLLGDIDLRGDWRRKASLRHRGCV